MRNKVTACIGILALMFAIGALDALLIEKELLMNWRTETPEITEEPPVLEVPQQQVPTGGVAKILEPNVAEISSVLGFSYQSHSDSTLIGQIVPPDHATTQSVVLLKDNDRAGVIAWVDSPQVKIYFMALKEALHSTFSADVKDLVDETQERPGKPTRNLLTFKDPVISEERIVFVRIRERLYEIHVAEGMDEAMFNLVETLTN